uniref:ADAM metallopeptidase domain 11 n=1 Tax=Chelydra serpentina TaxID=8475 RepID=A0A8C3SPZ1_CHESE
GKGTVHTDKGIPALLLANVDLHISVNTTHMQTGACTHVGKHSSGEHCYYQGKLRGEARSLAALSSCPWLEDPALPIITPTDPDPAALLPLGCLFAALSHQGPDARPRLRRRRQVRRAQHTVHSETKYIELVVVNDHQLFEQLRQSVVLTSNFAKSVVNLADMIYKEQLNTRIVLVAMETWASQDKIHVEADSLQTLSEFMRYRTEALPEQSDAVHLFSGRTFQSSRSGTAYVGGVCSLTRGGGVNEVGGKRVLPVLGQKSPGAWRERGPLHARAQPGLCASVHASAPVPPCLGLMGESRAVSVSKPPLLSPPTPAAADRFCYEKLNVEGTERGNCGREGPAWVQCSKQDVLCGYLLCTNITGVPRLGELSGEITTMTFYHQNRYVDCRGGHVRLVDGSDLSYVEDGTPCGPSMLCLDHKCLPTAAFNFSSCPSSWDGMICFDHGVCSSEGKCICHADWTGKDCSVYDPIPEPRPTGETERYKGPSGTNIIIGSIAGAVLVAAIVLGGTGWGFK